MDSSRRLLSRMVQLHHPHCPFPQWRALAWPASTMHCSLWFLPTIIPVTWSSCTVCIVHSHNNVTLHCPTSPSCVHSWFPFTILLAAWYASTTCIVLPHNCLTCIVQ